MIYIYTLVWINEKYTQTNNTYVRLLQILTNNYWNYTAQFYHPLGIVWKKKLKYLKYGNNIYIYTFECNTTSFYSRSD